MAQDRKPAGFVHLRVKSAYSLLEGAVRPKERHRREYREFNRTPRRDQREYWHWRHEHQDWH